MAKKIAWKNKCYEKLKIGLDIFFKEENKTKNAKIYIETDLSRQLKIIFVLFI